MNIPHQIYEIYEEIAKKHHLPVTSVPTSEFFAELIKQVYDAGYANGHMNALAQKSKDAYYFEL